MNQTETELRNEALETILKSHASSQGFLRKKHRQWRSDFKLLRGLDSTIRRANQKWKSDVRVAISRPYFDILVSRFFQGMPAAKSIGQTLRSSLNEPRFNMLLNRDQDRMNLPQVMNPFIKDGIEKGLAVFRDGWKTDSPTTIPHTKEWMDAKLKAIRKGNPKAKLKDIFYDGPVACWVDPFLVWWDPNSYQVDMGQYFGETEYLSDSEVMTHPWIDKATAKEGIKGRSEVNQDVMDRLRDLGYGAAHIRDYAKSCSSGVNEVLWYWGLFDINDDGIDEEVRMYSLNRIVSGKPEENLYEHGERPYNVWSFDAEPGSMIGMSFMDRVRSLQIEYDDTTNHFADNRKLTNNPVTKYKLGSDLNPLDLVMAPGLPIPVENSEDVTYERMPSFGPELQSYLVALREVFQLMTGANDVTLGQQDVGIGDNTATGASIAQEQTEMRFKQPALMLDQAIIRFGNHLISNEQQYRDSDEEVAVKDGENVKYETIAPEEIAGTFSYQMVSGSLTQDSSVMQVNKLIQFKQIVNGNPNYDLAKVDDMIAEAMNINPATIKKATVSAPSDDAQQLAASPPEVQAAATKGMPQKDAELLQAHLANLQNGTPQPLPPGAQQPAPGPQIPPGMGNPGNPAPIPPGIPPQAPR